MIGFWLKKFISAWLMPLPLSATLLTIGCILLWCKRERIARWLITFGLGVLLVASCTAISDLALLPIEERYPKWQVRSDNLDYIVVMGASQGEAPRLPLTNRPNTAAVYRLLEGVAIYRANPDSKLVLSGGGVEESHAVLMAQVARAIGISASDIVLQTTSLDTEQEVGLLKPIVEGHRFAVVTSAAHMPRTMLLFHTAGLDPIAAPTHFLDRDNPHPNWRDLFWPNADSLERADFAAHEYLGLLWLEIKSRFQ
ncbi:MAG TPA: ElyC/SanA/YdcF family protein [Spongiibacteraceae bacterium]|nr:ElyC/SanA/YdcF family protein [Spongiibacteraceae bacterium]